MIKYERMIILQHNILVTYNFFFLSYWIHPQKANKSPLVGDQKTNKNSLVVKIIFRILRFTK